MKKLYKKGDKELALNYIKKILKLIETSHPLPVDNSPWPLKGKSLLFLAEFLFEIQEFKKSQEIIEQALEEINLKKKNILIEKAGGNIDGFQQVKTHHNEYNLEIFRSLCVYSYLNINKIEKAKEILLAIDPNVNVEVNDYEFISIHPMFTKLAHDNNVYYRSAKMIALTIAKNNPVDAIELILRNSNISEKDKFNFGKIFLSRFSYHDNIKLFRKSFENLDMLDLLIDCLCSILRDSPNLHDEFKYLSSFTKYFSNEKSYYDSRSASYSSSLLNITYARVNDYYLLTKEKKNIKMNILYQLIYNDHVKN